MTRKFAIGAAVSLATVVATANCHTYGDAGSGVSFEAGAETDAAASDGERLDATADAAPDAGCVTLFDDAFASPTLEAGWFTLGAAGEVRGGEAVLTTNGLSSSAGALWHAVMMPPDTALEIDVTLNIDPISATTADGIAIAWTDDASVVTLGGIGSSLGVCSGGPKGALGFGIFTLLENGARQMGLIDVEKPSCTGTLFNYVLTPALRVTLRIDGTTLHGMVDGNAFVQTLPRAITIGGIGFGAGTGANSSTQAISNLHVSACPSE